MAWGDGEKKLLHMHIFFVPILILALHDTVDGSGSFPFGPLWLFNWVNPYRSGPFGQSSVWIIWVVVLKLILEGT